MEVLRGPGRKVRGEENALRYIAAGAIIILVGGAHPQNFHAYNFSVGAPCPAAAATGVDTLRDRLRCFQQQRHIVRSGEKKKKKKER